MTTLSRVFPKRHAGSQGFDALALGMGATGMWPLRETNGTVAEDLSGNSYDGGYENTPTLGVKMTRPPRVAGVTRAANFDGVSEHVDLDAHVNNFKDLVACTVVMQFTTESAPGFDELFALSGNTSDTINWSFAANGTGDLAVRSRDAGGQTLYVETAANIDTSGTVLNFAAFATDGSGNEFWFNGAQETTYLIGNANTAAGFNTASPLNTMRIGIRNRLSGNFGPWDGSIWNVAVFPARLTAAQLNTLYLATVYGG